MRSFLFRVRDSSNAGEIRRKAAHLAPDLDFKEPRSGRISIVINELCSNIVKHAGNGEVILSVYNDTLHILALDKGPGLRNVKECLRDGYSSIGTAGNGLGAIKRLSDSFELFSQAGRGTALYAAFCLEKKSYCCELGAVFIPYPGEQVSGDGWFYEQSGPSSARLLVADGLGHGLLAHEASRAAIERFKASPGQSPADSLFLLHTAMTSTRGAAIAIAEVDFKGGNLSYAGLGNIAGTLVTHTTSKRLVSFNGTVGLQYRKVTPLNYPLDEQTTLVMSSDGLGSQWGLSNYPGLLNRHPALIAGVLYRDFGKNNDDVTVVVLRRYSPGGGHISS